MPNHETNHVVVIGDPAAMKQFMDEAFSPGDKERLEPEQILDFNLIVPQPANIEQGGCGGGAVGGIHLETGEVCWYSWNCDNWGTKWGAYSHEERELVGHEGEVQLRLRFDTAWSAPTPIFEAIEKRWDLKVVAITIDEGGFPPVHYGDDAASYIRLTTDGEFV